jgi:hypothetical protein
MAGQVKALSMILAMEGLIPSRTTHDRGPSVEPQIPVPRSSSTSSPNLWPGLQRLTCARHAKKRRRRPH